MTPAVTAIPLVRAGATPPPLVVPPRGPLPFPVAGDDAEAEVAAARRAGRPVAVAAPFEVAGADLAGRERVAGHAAVEALRRDPELLPWLRAATWSDAAPAARALRALSLRVRRRSLSLAYWAGVREAAEPEEWRWLTSSYSVLVYHRLAGEMRDGQERLDVPARTFHRQLRALRRLGFRFATVDDLVAFHRDRAPLPARSVVVTVDDGTADVVEPLLREVAAARPQLFVVTAAGPAASWLGDTPLASATQIAELARAGVLIGAHSRTHADLVAASDAELEDEVGGSVADVRAALGATAVPFAYPNGRFDDRVAAAVARAGSPYAFSTLPGANGAAADRFALRRVSVKAWDSALSTAWKAMTGRPVPALWESWLALRYALARRLRR